MNKGSLQIHSMDFPSKMSNKGKNQLNRFHLDDMRKGFSVVDAFLLRKVLHNKVCFMSLNNTFIGKFGPIYPSTLHILSLWLGN
jgi:hypothetical protein